MVLAEHVLGMLYQLLLKRETTLKSMSVVFIVFAIASYLSNCYNKHNFTYVHAFFYYLHERPRRRMHLIFECGIFSSVDQHKTRKLIPMQNVGLAIWWRSVCIACAPSLPDVVRAVENGNPIKLCYRISSQYILPFILGAKVDVKHSKFAHNVLNNSRVEICSFNWIETRTLYCGVAFTS